EWWARCALPTLRYFIDAARVRHPSASPIRRIAPGRDQQRHVEMALGLADGKPQRYQVQKRRVRHRHLSLRKILADTKHQFVAADRHRPPMNERMIGAAVGVGDRA